MYESFYKLTKQPFQLSPDPRFFYGSPSHKRAMSYLRYGLTQGEGFIVITGDIGTGKTMLVNTLFNDLPKENVVAAQLVTTQLKEDDTLRMVAASFGLPHEGLEKATILKNLETFMTARMRQGKRMLLLVDEVQNLPIRSLEELRMLSNFQLGGRVLFQSFLLGQAEFRKTIQAKGLEQLRQRVIAAYHLEALDGEQTRGYIEHRLAAAGWKNDPKFTDAAYSAIYKYSGGIPRRINSLCDRLLLYGVLENVHEFDGEKIDIVFQELKRETSCPDAVRGDERGGGKDNKSVVPLAGKRQQLNHRAAVGNEAQAVALEGDVETRVAQLEQRVINLEEALRRLRHAILQSGDAGEYE
jgi:general secretion pathway protein A